MRPHALILLTACGRIDIDAIATVDAPPGAWAVVTTTGDTVYSTDDHTVQIDVAAGDLLIAGCDHHSQRETGAVTLTTNSIITLPPPRTTYDLASFYTTQLTWGVAREAGTVTMTWSGFDSFQGNFYSDCSATVFRGGSASPQLQDQTTMTGGAGGLVSCNPIKTQPGSVAFYFAARSTCIDVPTGPPFVQLGTSFGNVWGAWAPADGTTIGTTLSDCGDTGGWLCSMISITP